MQIIAHFHIVFILIFFHLIDVGQLSIAILKSFLVLCSAASYPIV